MNLNHTTIEWCSNCGNEVEICSNGVQKCPICLEDILPCSDCVKQNCLKCPHEDISDT